MTLPLDRALLCDRCGSPATVIGDDNSFANCDACEWAFRQAMAREFPFGQCDQCGASYDEYRCEQGKTHVGALHVEGACGRWADAPPLEPGDIAAGYCSSGCRPAVAPQPVGVVDDYELPFLMTRLDICRCPRCENTEDGTELLGADWPPIPTRAQALQARLEATLQIEHDAGFHDRGYGEPDDRCPGCQWQRTYDKQRGIA